MNARTLSLLAACLLAAALPAQAEDWPQWQGPNRDNVSKEKGLLQSWPKGGPKLLWTYDEAGNGYAGPAVVGDRLYILGTRGDTETLLAIDVGTGKEVWASPIAPYLANGSTKHYGIGPRSTPTVDGDRIYALGSQGDLVCVETNGGKQVWKVSLPADLKGQMMSGWGWSESPLVDGDHVICSPGGSKGTLAALDKKSGSVVWRSKELTDPAAYSSIVISEAGGVRQYVQLTGKGIVGVAAKDGKLLWRVSKPEYRTAVIPTPIVHGDLVYTTVDYGAGCDLLKLTPQGEGGIAAQELYERTAQKNLQDKHEGVVLVGDSIYGYSETNRGQWVCQALETGKVRWGSKQLGRGSVTCADNRLYCYTETDGTAALAEPNPSGWKEHGRFTIPRHTAHRQFNNNIWPHPVVANGHLYLRDQEFIFCYDVKDHGAGAQ
ncbi:MAG TPA: PQQ-binding-like beta-propeller repeat protein [Gemmataceae bacterium]|nr:PQQ-binding-like beta-propeller repeat protein [Gemmataceae bacterium]